MIPSSKYSWFRFTKWAVPHSPVRITQYSSLPYRTWCEREAKKCGGRVVESKQRVRLASGTVTEDRWCCAVERMAREDDIARWEASFAKRGKDCEDVLPICAEDEMSPACEPEIELEPYRLHMDLATEVRNAFRAARFRSR